MKMPLVAGVFAGGLLLAAGISVATGPDPV